MKRITAVLRGSEATAVRKAVCMAGAECVVIVPMPLCHGQEGIPLQPARRSQHAAQSKVHVRLEVTAEDIHYGGIVAAIKRVAQAGKVVPDLCHEMAPRHGMLPVRTAHLYPSPI